MTISYPLSLPSTPGVQQITLHAVNNVGVVRCPYTFTAQIQAHTGQAWAAQVQLPPMEREDAEPWLAFLIALGGQYGTFLMGDPLGKTAQGEASGTPKVDGASQSGQTLATKGWTASKLVLKAGDYIQLGQRLHKVLVDATSDGSGEVTLDIWPRLREAPADNATILVSNCVGLFRLTENIVPICALSEEKLYDVSFDAIEAL